MSNIKGKRATQETINNAKELYDGGYNLSEISELLNLSAKTLSNWKIKYNWTDDERNKPLSKEEEMFCIYYIKTLNATKSCKKAYGCTYIEANVKGSKLLQRPKIRRRIDELVYENVDKEVLQKTVLQKYIDIAFADITEFYEFNDEGVAHLKPDIDGTIITEVVTADGEVKIKLADKMKALETLTKFSGLLDDETRKKLEEENLRLRNEKLEVEIKLANGGDKEEYEDDGFIEAINRKVDDIWEEN